MTLDEPSAEAAAVATEQSRSLLEAVRRLPHRQREAVALRYYLDLSQPEIAELMGISQGTVRTAISRAMARRSSAATT